MIPKVNTNDKWIDLINRWTLDKLTSHPYDCDKQLFLRSLISITFAQLPGK